MGPTQEQPAGELDPGERYQFLKGNIYFLKNLCRGDTREGVLGISVETHSQTPSISEGEAALHTAQRTTVLTVPEKSVEAPARL